MSAVAPLVSCLMPTADRPRFVAVAVRHFLRQTHEPKELIVVDDGRVAVVLPRIQGIHYHRLSRRLPLGEKRNLACSLAAGEILAHWDDDDWSTPTRLADQVRALTATGDDLCGLSALRYVDLRTGQGWIWRTDRHDAWLFGSSLCYRVGAWARSPFAAVDRGEDAAFVAAIDPLRRCDLGDLPLVVATLHGGNTSSRHGPSRDWLPLPATEVKALISESGVRMVTPSQAGTPARSRWGDPPERRWELPL